MIVKYNEELQVKRLRDTVQLAKNSEFYKERLANIEIESLEDIKKIPFTTKEELRKAGAFGLIAVPKTQLAEYHESFGTTGVPVSSWKTENDMKQAVKVVTAHGMQFTPEDMVLIRNPYALSAPAHEMQQAARAAGACIIPVSTRSDITSYTRTINLMYKLQPTIITCIPIEGFILAETAKMMGLDPKKDFPALRAFYCAGELMNEKRRRELEEIWDVDVQMFYGSTELGIMGSSCEDKQIHLYPENYLFEVLNPKTMEDAKPGEKGILIVTNLAREAQPIFRYNTGDIVEVVETECTCGSKHPILKHYGRYDDRVIIGEKELLFGELQDIVYSLKSGNFWKAFVREDLLEIQIEAEDICKSIEPALIQELKEKYDFPFEIVLVEEGKIINRESLLKQSFIGKPSYIVDSRIETKSDTTNPFIELTKRMKEERNK